MSATALYVARTIAPGGFWETFRKSQSSQQAALEQRHRFLQRRLGGLTADRLPSVSRGGRRRPWLATRTGRRSPKPVGIRGMMGGGLAANLDDLARALTAVPPALTELRRTRVDLEDGAMIVAALHRAEGERHRDSDPADRMGDHDVRQNQGRPAHRFVASGGRLRASYGIGR